MYTWQRNLCEYALSMPGIPGIVYLFRGEICFMEDPQEILRVARLLAERYAPRLNIHFDDAESECIDALLKAANTIDLTRSGSVWGYYDTVCRRQLIDYARKLSRWRHNANLRRDQSSAYTVDFGAEDPSAKYDPLVWQFLVEGFTISEIANSTGLPQVAVRQLIYRAVYELRGEEPVLTSSDKTRVTSPFAVRVRSKKKVVSHA